MDTISKRVFRVCLAVIAMTAWSASPAVAKNGTAVAKKIVGSASYTDANGKTQPLTVGTVLEEGWTVETGPGALVDLFLEHNGPYVGLFEDTTVKFNRLRYEPGALGEIVETELNVPRGQILSQVNKLLAGSRYEVISPGAVGKVRGTTFWWSAVSGEIHTLAGLVQLQLTLVADPGDELHPNPPPHFVDVPAGYSVFIPKLITLAALVGLTAQDRDPSNPNPTPLPQSVINRLVASAPKAGFVDDGTASRTVTEVFDADYIDVSKQKVLLRFGPGSPQFNILSN